MQIGLHKADPKIEFIPYILRRKVIHPPDNEPTQSKFNNVSHCLSGLDKGKE